MKVNLSEIEPSGDCYSLKVLSEEFKDVVSERHQDFRRSFCGPGRSVSDPVVHQGREEDPRLPHVGLLWRRTLGPCQCLGARPPGGDRKPGRTGDCGGTDPGGRTTQQVKECRENTAQEE